MKRKVRLRPPKFRVSVAMKDVDANIDMLAMSNENIYSTLMVALERLSETLSRNQLAPLPKDLQGSFYDPEMLRKRCDEDFMEIYKNDLSGTAEECVAIMMVLVLAYDVMNRTKLCIQKPGDDVFEYTGATARNDIIRCAKELRLRFNPYSYSLHEDKVIAELYPYLVKFAEALYLDLNAFIKWYIRGRNIC